jgi:hypothetical protein
MLDSILYSHTIISLISYYSTNTYHTCTTVSYLTKIFRWGIVFLIGRTEIKAKYSEKTPLKTQIKQDECCALLLSLYCHEIDGRDD